MLFLFSVCKPMIVKKSGQHIFVTDTLNLFYYSLSAFYVTKVLNFIELNLYFKSSVSFKKIIFIKCLLAVCLFIYLWVVKFVEQLYQTFTIMITIYQNVIEHFQYYNVALFVFYLDVVWSFFYYTQFEK